jgi:hypothetical protein
MKVTQSERDVRSIRTRILLKWRAHRELFSGAQPKVSNGNTVGLIALCAYGVPISHLAATSNGESQKSSRFSTRSNSQGPRSLNSPLATVLIFS